MWALLTILAFHCAGTHAQDMAVLLGGYNTDQHTHWKSVDVYTTHLKDSEKLCESTGAVPFIPDLPLGTQNHAAIFLPNSGIFVCGWLGDMSQQLSECWNYDPRISRYVWFYLKHSFVPVP